MAEDELSHPYRQRPLFGGADTATRVEAVRLPPERRHAAPLEQTGQVVGVAHGESRAVRDTVVETFYRVAGATGTIREPDLLRALRADHSIAVHAGNLPGIVAHIDELVRLPGGTYASLAGRENSVLTRLLRRLLSVCPGGLPVDIVSLQLVRHHHAYAGVEAADLLAFAEAHPDFQCQDDRIRPYPGRAFRAQDELGAHERRVHEAIRGARMPLVADQVGQFTRHHAKIPPTTLKVVLRESVVLVTIPDGRVDALRPSSGLLTRIRQTR